MGKLKRFLLRYDPPGIGLEIQQDDHSLNVVHKDLPLAAQIRGVQDIASEVDRIIAEDDLLTKKRHRPALMQLLGRLYQVDVDGEDEDVEASEKTSLLQEDCSVVLIGLSGDLAAHNGEVGVLTKCRHDKSKYEVRLADKSHAEVKIKGTEHLAPAAPKGSAMAVGVAVVIRGLRNHTELNGCLGRVVEINEETHRFEVRAVASNQLFRVKQENLVLIHNAFCPPAANKENREPNTNISPRGLRKEAAPAGSPAAANNESVASLAQASDDDVFEAGSLVELQGLKTAMAFNGQQAEVLSVDRARSRYEIRLDDGSVKTIRAENVKLVSKAAKASPRTPRRKDGGGAKAADRRK